VLAAGAVSEALGDPEGPLRRSAMNRSCSISERMLWTSDVTYVRNSSGVMWIFCFRGGESQVTYQGLKTVHLEDDIAIALLLHDSERC